MIGIGAMVHEMSGNRESAEVFSAAVGKTIVGLALGEDEALHFAFSDGTRFKLIDSGQSCCESRYMRTDDKLEDYFGAILEGGEVRDAGEIEDPEGESHEVAFLVIATSKGSFTMSSHVEHNGYYGGFAIEAIREAA